MEIIVIIFIAVLQFVVFVKNYDNLKIFKEIYPNTKTLRINWVEGFVQGIESKHNNSVFKVIISSISKYLVNNKGQISDYHLIKDIVDRNTEAKEDEINTQIPVPLYLGLVGTMLCILIGLLFLNLESVVNGSEQDMIKGIRPLLSGVAYAMITSVLGVALTTWGSWSAKNAKIKVEENKNTFLTWMQAELLPNLSNDTAQTLQKLSRNLTNFNNTFAGSTANFNSEFAQNTTGLKNALATVTNTYKDLSGILTAINNMKIAKIASANIEVYEKLKNCTNEIEKLGEYLQDINQYQANTNDAIKEMHKFLSNGNVQIDSINGKVREALEKFGTDTEKYLKNLRINLDSQIGDVNNAVQKQQGELITVLEQQKDELAQYFETISTQMQTTANEQQELFKQKLDETTALVDELKNLSAVKNSMSELVKQTSLQSRQIEQLTKEIREFAKTKANPIPMWMKIAGIVIGGSVGLAGLVVIIYGISMLLNL